MKAMVVALHSSSTDIWQIAQWGDYLAERDRPYDQLNKQKIYFHQNRLFFEMGAEGINHAKVSDLFTMLFFVLSMQSEIPLYSLGRCLLEQPSTKISAAPDLILYTGDTEPKWQEGDRHYLNLDEWGMPALVGEISDTTIIHDLDEKKHLYAALGISEYWVIDVQAQRVFVFILDSEKGKYVASETSSILTGLKAELLVAALNRLENEGNTQVAQWFAQQLQTQTEKSGE